MTKTSGIYKIICVPTQKYYYGSSADIDRRWYLHKSALRRNEHDNRHLQFAWKKYGEEAFQIEVAKLVPIEKLLEVETVYLNEHVGRPDCFNLASDATAPFRGRKHSTTTKRKMTKTRTGKQHSETTRRRISEAQKGKRHPYTISPAVCESRRGRQHSTTTRRKMSDARKLNPSKRDSLGRFQKAGIV